MIKVIFMMIPFVSSANVSYQFTKWCLG